jgi:predicted RNase H-like HicB family nuclease
MILPDRFSTLTNNTCIVPVIIKSILKQAGYRRHVMKLTYPAIFYQGEGGYAIEVPDLPGCVSGGKTLAEAITMGTDAASGWVLTELEDGKPIPKSSDIADVHPEQGGFVSILLLDMDIYAERYGNKSVRKNLTKYSIPA